MSNGDKPKRDIDTNKPLDTNTGPNTEARQIYVELAKLAHDSFSKRQNYE